MENIKTHLISALESFIAGFGLAVAAQLENIINSGLTMSKELIFSILVGAIFAGVKTSVKLFRLLLVDVITYYFKD